MNTMRPSTSTLSRALPALLAAAVASIVLGIIGMHALNTHAVAGNTDHAMTSPMTGSHADMSADMSTGPETGSPAGLVPDDGGSGHDLGGTVMLCFAMLAVTAGALLLLRVGVRRRPHVWAHLPTAPTVTRWVTARLGTGPPPAWAFSVIRC